MMLTNYYHKWKIKDFWEKKPDVMENILFRIRVTWKFFYNKNLLILKRRLCRILLFSLIDQASLYAPGIKWNMFSISFRWISHDPPCLLLEVDVQEGGEKGHYYVSWLTIVLYNCDNCCQLHVSNVSRDHLDNQCKTIELHYLTPLSQPKSGDTA